MKISSLLLTAVAALALWTGANTPASAHCEIPCGIYTDQMRIDMIEEHCKTIEKSMVEIVTLGGDPGTNANQLIRWVSNKEDHANQIQEIVTQYFLTQRIKPDAAKYEQKLALLHQMLVAAMKAKQTTDPVHVTKIRELSDAFSKLYFR